MNFGTPSKDQFGNRSILSYAEPDDPWFKKILIGAIENLTGKPRLERLANDLLTSDIPPGRIMGEALRGLNITLEIDGDSLRRIPGSGPLVFIANHPFGVVDGLALCDLASRVRKDYAILVNAVLCREPRLRPFLLPVDFRETPEALRTNLTTRTEATDRLARGEAIAIFPSGAVATAPFPGKKPVELEWKRFVVKLITRSNATVVPVYFHGENSFWFQLASYIHMNLRLAVLLHEVRNKMGKPLRVSIGEPIDPSEWRAMDPVREVLPFLREKTMALGESPDHSTEGMPAFS